MTDSQNTTPCGHLSLCVVARIPSVDVPADVLTIMSEARDVDIDPRRAVGRSKSML